MKFKFKNQQFQTDAAAAVSAVFNGQPNLSPQRYRRSTGDTSIQKQLDDLQMSALEYGALSDEDKRLLDEGYEAAYKNPEIRIDKQKLLSNIRDIQGKNGIKLSPELVAGLGAVSLDIEMETGTGKTYVYIKTMFELYKKYGWGKFIVVVPSVAIREGVRKSFEMLEDHFMEQYGIKARYFVYNSQNLHQLDEFSQNAGPNVMIINTQAFNTTMNEDKNVDGRSGNEAARIIYTKRDSFGSRRPIDVIRANRPIIIIDEPQKILGAKDAESKAMQALKKNFDPLFSINYSATHKVKHNLIYQLDALDAFEKKLVKKIEVKGIEFKNIVANSGYMYLERIVIDPKKPPRAKMEYEVKHKSGAKRETHFLNVGDSLYEASNGLEEYKGVTITAINPITKTVEFSANDGSLGVITAGTATGDADENLIRRIQIRETIASHFDKEEKLFNQGIKCLSLFFIDEVAKYRSYDEDGADVLGEYGKIFEEEYLAELHERRKLTEIDKGYQKYLLGIDYQKTHAGYFSIDKKGRATDGATEKGTDLSNDISAYDLILKNKERLLSLDEPTRFIFSHSALREGWDNPNVFQICTLKHSGSDIAKRQEVGRGLRLCVNKNGDRQDTQSIGEQTVHDVNLLTIVASESYADFVSGLQSEIKAAMYERPAKADKDYFAGKIITLADGAQHEITAAEATAMYKYLLKNDYIDNEEKVSNVYKNDAQAGELAPLPKELDGYGTEMHKLVSAIFDESAFKEMIADGHATKITENPINKENWELFKELWEKINKKYAYKVKFDDTELHEKCVAAINKELKVAGKSYEVKTGIQVGSEFDVNKTSAKQLKEAPRGSAEYDIVGKIADGTNLTRKSAADILTKIDRAKMALFLTNPEEYIANTVKIINDQKASIIVEHITYAPSKEEPYTQDIFNMSKADAEYNKAFKAKRAVQDYIFTDGTAEQSIEKRFAKDLDTADEVAVYAKLPRGFKISTPVGNYSPDWAISFKKGAVKHIFFIAETKVNMDSLDLRPIEQAKISCAEKLFNQINTNGVKYHKVNSYENLLKIIGSL